MTEEEKFITAMEGAKEKAIAISASPHDGPVLPIYAVHFRNLPDLVAPDTKELILALNKSAAVHDRSVPDRKADDTIGAMRQIHTNNPKYLPPNTPSLTKDTVQDVAGRGKVYSTYVQRKGHTNDRKGEATNTGYVEYTAGHKDVYNSQLSRMRIVFDYLYGRVFLTPFHYQSWQGLGTGDFKVVDKPPPGSAFPNPFYWIIEIPGK